MLILGHVSKRVANIAIFITWKIHDTLKKTNNYSLAFAFLEVETELLKPYCSIKQGIAGNISSYNDL